MYNYLIRTFIPDYQNTHDADVRKRYGIFFALLSLLLNGVLSLSKIIFGYLSHSQAMIADGINNLSDMSSNLVVLIGFRVASKHPDREHPYGHGRYEYVAGVVVSVIIVAIGLMALKEAILKIIHPVPVIFKLSSLAVLILGIMVKLFMYYFDKATAKSIQSETYEAAAKDSLNDVLTTSVTMVALIFHQLPVDGWIGAIVSLVVLFGGIHSLQETLSPLIGERPNRELIKQIADSILKYDRILGIHDLMYHDYGIAQRYMSLHAEVNAHENLVSIHELIDKIERDIFETYHVDTTIHIDPVDLDDPLTQKLRQEVIDIVSDISAQYSVHDFRIVKTSDQTKLIFDVLIPYDHEQEEDELIEQINKAVKALNQSYVTVITIDHLLV